MKRTIQKQLQAPLALAILSGEFIVGDSIRVDVENGELVFPSIPTSELVGDSSA